MVKYGSKVCRNYCHIDWKSFDHENKGETLKLKSLANTKL
jgi:hypothetical protein